MIDRLSGEFIRGYTKSLLDVERVLDETQEMLRVHRKNHNYKTIKNVISVMIRNRDEFREESGPNSPTMCYSKEKGFDMYDKIKRKKEVEK